METNPGEARALRFEEVCYGKPVRTLDGPLHENALYGVSSVTPGIADPLRFIPASFLGNANLTSSIIDPEFAARGALIVKAVDEGLAIMRMRYRAEAGEEMLENLIATLTESDLARDKVAGQHYESLLARFGRNAYYRSRIAADIYKNYPDLLPNDSKKLMEFLRGLLTESGCNFDMRNFDEKLVGSVAENMQNIEPWLLPNAVNMRKMAQVELDNASLNTPTDEKKKAAIIEFAAAHEMQKTWDDISDIIVRAEAAGIRVPTKLRRLQLLWPRESSTTLSEFLTFEHKHKHILGEKLSETYGYDSVLYA